TKGAIYGNFENKESLALYAFQYNRSLLLETLDKRLAEGESSLDKLFSLLGFYKQYDLFTLPLIGCPIQNVGVDDQGNNTQLAEAVREPIKEKERTIALRLESEPTIKEIDPRVPRLQYAKQL